MPCVGVAGVHVWSASSAIDLRMRGRRGDAERRRTAPLAPSIGSCLACARLARRNSRWACLMDLYPRFLDRTPARCNSHMQLVEGIGHAPVSFQRRQRRSHLSLALASAFGGDSK